MWNTDVWEQEAQVERSRGASCRQERLGLLPRSHLCAALDDKALGPGFSESTLPLPALTCHLTFLSHHLLRGAQNDGDCQDEYKQLAMEPLPLAFAEHA